MTDDLKKLALAAKAATAAYIADPTDRETGRQWDRACAEFSLACTEDAILTLIRERDDTLAALAVAREGAKDALASLVAAVSLLERGGKKAAASDKMFGMMLSDYKASIARTRAALKEATDGR